VWRSDPELRATIKTLLLMAASALAYVAARLTGRHWQRAPYWPTIYRDNLNIPVEHDYEI
jgi:hypothetical protein